MSRCTRAKASPKSFESMNALPPVSEASDTSVSCDADSRENCCDDATAGEERAAAAAGLARVAAGDHGLEAARVDGVDGDVGADRGVDRRAQLHLVVFAAALHAGAEIQNRFLLLERRQRLGERLERAQPHVVVEHVHRDGVFRRRRFVGGGEFVGGDGVGRGRRGRGAFGVAEPGQRGANLRRDPR